MLIHSEMCVIDLCEHMGDIATLAEGSAMREILVRNFDGKDTADIGEAAWREALDEACRRAGQWQP